MQRTAIFFPYGTATLLVAGGKKALFTITPRKFSLHLFQTAQVSAALGTRLGKSSMIIVFKHIFCNRLPAKFLCTVYPHLASWHCHHLLPRRETTRRAAPLAVYTSEMEEHVLRSDGKRQS